MKKISSEKLLQIHGEQFTKLYLSGKTVEEIKPIMKLTHHYAYMLKRLLHLHQERWQRVGMPPIFSDKIESLIYGTLMGDASIHISGGNKYRILSMSHSYKQEDYLIHKRELLLELKPYSIKSLHDKWNTYRFITPPHPQFDEIHQNFYGTGTKQISNDILSKLTPQAIAWWFMDDGGLQSNARGFNIATCSFNKKSISNIRNYLLDKYRIETKLYNYDYPRLSIYGKNARKFESIIQDYIIPSMQYKIQLGEGVGRVR